MKQVYSYSPTSVATIANVAAWVAAGIWYQNIGIALAGIVGNAMLGAFSHFSKTR